MTRLARRMPARNANENQVSGRRVRRDSKRFVGGVVGVCKGHRV
jgi:hypothetical protein